MSQVPDIHFGKPVLKFDFSRINALSGPKKVEETLTEDSLCQWIPARDSYRDRGFVCTNHIYRNPESRALEHTCPWHVPKCIHPSHSHDADTRGGRILVPNEEGLCVAHYVAKHGKPPVAKSHPYPGMMTKASMVTHEIIRTHWGAPTGEFKAALPPPRQYVSFESLRPTTFMKIQHWVKQRAREARGLLKRRTAAEEIQAVVRMWLAYRKLKRLRDRRRGLLRGNAAPIIQGASKHPSTKTHTNTIVSPLSIMFLHAHTNHTCAHTSLTSSYTYPATCPLNHSCLCARAAMVRGFQTRVRSALEKERLQKAGALVHRLMLGYIARQRCKRKKAIKVV